jgi:hypothetical protein
MGSERATEPTVNQAEVGIKILCITRRIQIIYRNACMEYEIGIDMRGVDGNSRSNEQEHRPEYSVPKASDAILQQFALLYGFYLGLPEVDHFLWGFGEGLKKVNPQSVTSPGCG